MNVKVTILLSTYNGKQYLREQLDSLCNQKGVWIKLLVRDDGSDDNTYSIVKEYADRLNVTILDENSNLGSAKSFMRLLEMADESSDYYAFCDQDDVWKEKKLIKAIEALKKCDEQTPALYYSAVRQVDEYLKEMKLFKTWRPSESLGQALISNEAPGCTMVFNRKLMELLKLYNPGYILMHDNWTVLVCMAVGGAVIFDPEGEILYRRHGNNVTGIDNNNPGTLRLFNYRVKKLFTFNYDHVRTARELLQGYGDYMEKESREIIECLASGRRFKILFNRRIKSKYFVYNLKFVIQMLLKGS